MDSADEKDITNHFNTVVRNIHNSIAELKE